VVILLFELGLKMRRHFFFFFFLPSQARAMWSTPLREEELFFLSKSLSSRFPGNRLPLSLRRDELLLLYEE